MGSAVLAQNAIEFIDPLDGERARIEQSTRQDQNPPKAPRGPSQIDPAQEESSANLLTRAREGASSGASAVQERANGFWSRMRASLSEVADNLGLPTSGLVGLLALLLAALVLLAGWTLFRGRKTHRTDENPDDVYARSSKDRSTRRKPGDKRPAPQTATSQSTAFTETMPEDFDAIFTEEVESKNSHIGTPAVPEKIIPRKDDTSTWRKPNLDQLRDSIKADWQASKKRPVSDNDSLHRDATPTAAAKADPGERTLMDVSDGWEDWDAQADSEDTLWGEKETLGNTADKGEDTAALRIRALRESLRAS